MVKKIFNWVAGPLAAVGFGLLLLTEARRPLRKKQPDKLRRVGTNLALGAATGGVMQLMFIPATAAASRFAQKKRLGLLNRLNLPEPFKTALGVAALDYSFYWWHRLLHHTRLLWRFHSVHHSDLDLDVSTAARFHFGEWVFSTAFRAGQVVLIGAGPAAESLFDVLMVLATEFHHSNVWLNVRLERRLNLLIVTPRMHGVHHSIIEREAGSNFATILRAWDLLHGTLRLNVPQDKITVGLARLRDPRELTIVNLLRMPFDERRDLWRLVDGTRPTRAALPAPKSELAP